MPAKQPISVNFASCTRVLHQDENTFEVQHGIYSVNCPGEGGTVYTIVQSVLGG